MIRNLERLIIDEGLSWIGTKFQHQGRIKKKIDANNRVIHNGGCDCLGLLLGIAINLKLRDINNCLFTDIKISTYNYPIRDYSLLINLKKHLFYKYWKSKEIKLSIGDVLLFEFNNIPCHIGIVMYENGQFIHTYNKVNSVILASMSDFWLKKIVDIFKLFNETSITDHYE